MLWSSILESRKEVTSREWTEFISLGPLKAFAGSYVDLPTKMIPFLATLTPTFSCFFLTPSFLHVLQRGVKEKSEV